MPILLFITKIKKRSEISVKNLNIFLEMIRLQQDFVHKVLQRARRLINLYYSYIHQLNLVISSVYSWPFFEVIFLL